MERLDPPPTAEVFPVTSCGLLHHKPDYSVAIDVEKYAERLQELGMPPEKIANLSVEFGPAGPFVVGSYDKAGKIVINSPLSSSFYRHRRLSGKNSHERVEKELNRDINKTLIHETQHAMEGEGVYRASSVLVQGVSLAIGTAAGLGLGVLTDTSVSSSVADSLPIVVTGGITRYIVKKVSYLTPINLSEHRARRFAKKHIKDEGWQDIIRIWFDKDGTMPDVEESDWRKNTLDWKDRETWMKGRKKR